MVGAEASREPRSWGELGTEVDRGEFVSITAALFGYLPIFFGNGKHDAEKLKTLSCGSEHQFTVPLAQYR
jgi:hypothetical protein